MEFVWLAFETANAFLYFKLGMEFHQEMDKIQIRSMEQTLAVYEELCDQSYEVCNFIRWTVNGSSKQYLLD